MDQKVRRGSTEYLSIPNITLADYFVDSRKSGVETKIIQSSQPSYLFQILERIAKY